MLTPPYLILPEVPAGLAAAEVVAAALEVVAAALEVVTAALEVVTGVLEVGAAAFLVVVGLAEVFKVVGAALLATNFGQ